MIFNVLYHLCDQTSRQYCQYYNTVYAWSYFYIIIYVINGGHYCQYYNTVYAWSYFITFIVFITLLTFMYLFMLYIVSTKQHYVTTDKYKWNMY